VGAALTVVLVLTVEEGVGGSVPVAVPLPAGVTLGEAEPLPARVPLGEAVPLPEGVGLGEGDGHRSETARTTAKSLTRSRPSVVSAKPVGQ
jgi:hypothetical protein